MKVVAHLKIRNLNLLRMQYSTVAFLCAKGADVHCQDRQGSTPMVKLWSNIMFIYLCGITVFDFNLLCSTLRAN